MKKFILCITVLFLLAGCFGKELPPAESAKIDYEKAKQYLDNGEYGKANLFLESFGAQHPYSQYAIQAELLRVFAAYKNDEYILSETLSEQFVKRHPRHPDVAYAKYLLAMTYFKQVSSEDRDQSTTQLTINAFKTLISQHPKSAYAKDAAPRLQSLFNKISSHELTVGKYYFNKERYVAAANRFQVVLDKYQTTPAIEEALYYLAASYSKLGITESARETVILLQHNYPKSDWSSKAADLL
ncbi:MAG: outer membrane protein assembly factor BamD [Mariprofundaceae bacterium]